MHYFNEEFKNRRMALVAEDDKDTRTRIADFLRDRGYGVLETETSIGALLLATEFPDRIDVLFTSVELRKFCNGVELAGCLKASRPEMAVVYLSGTAGRNVTAEREILLGEAGSLRKPLTGKGMELAAAEAEAYGAMWTPVLRETMAWA